MRILAFICLLFPLIVAAADLTKAQRAAIEERIKPFSDVCVAGDDSCGGGGVAAAAGPRSGEAVYNAACMACHATGAAGAPMVGDAAAWSPRIANGMDALYNSGINGVAGTGMMARGGCVDCGDEEINAAVDYMVDNSR